MKTWQKVAIGGVLGLVVVLVVAITLDAMPDEGVIVAATASGDLTLDGVTRSVSFELEARRVAGEIEVLGAIPVVFADYDIEDPSNPIVSVRDNGELEFLLVLAPA